MSEENVEVVRRAVEEFNDAGAAGPRFDEAFDRQIEFHDEVGTCEGREELVSYLEGFAEAIGGLHVDIEETWNLGETIVLAVAQSGTGSASHVPVAQPFTWVLEFEGGPRCVRWRIYADRQRAFEAAGLRE
jgi:ketosteroid isomerase-like protein